MGCLEQKGKAQALENKALNGQAGRYWLSLGCCADVCLNVQGLVFKMKAFGYEIEMKFDLVKLFIIVLAIILIVMMWLNYQELMQDPNKIGKQYCRKVCPCWNPAWDELPGYEILNLTFNQSSSIISRRSS